MAGHLVCGESLGEVGKKTENIVARLLRSSTSCVADQRLVEQNHLQMVGFEVKAEEKGWQSPDLPLVSSL